MKKIPISKLDFRGCTHQYCFCFADSDYDPQLLRMPEQTHIVRDNIRNPILDSIRMKYENPQEDN